ncbi:MAG: hypothetical protein P8P99_13420 [Maricaulis sp.]|nr:hypothetical protein [Maricaulis sp.]
MIDRAESSVTQAGGAPGRNGGSLSSVVPVLRWSVILYLAFLPIYYILPSDNSIRDIIYLFPLLIVAECLRREGVKIRRAGVVWILAYAGFGIIMLTQLNFAEIALKEYVFILLSISPFVLKFAVSRRFAKYLVVVGLVNVVIILTSTDATGLDLSVGSSSGRAESSFGLIVPIVFFALYIQKRWMWSLVAIVICFLMFKRVAIIAMILAVGFDLVLIGQARNAFKQMLKPIAGVTLLAFTMLVSLNSVVFYETASIFLLDSFDLRISPNALSSGRYYTVAVFTHRVLDDVSWVQIVFGHGPGASSYYLSNMTALGEGQFSLLHNDWLRIFTDYGLIGISVVSVAFYKAVMSKRFIAMVGVYTMVIFMSDNVATYLIFWLAVALLFAGTLDRVHGRIEGKRA